MLCQRQCCYEKWSVSQCVLVWGQHLQPTTNLSFNCLENICSFFLMGCPPWWEEGPATYPYNCYWPLSVLSLSGPGPAEFVTISYCLIWDWVTFLSSSLGYGGGMLSHLNMGIFFFLLGRPSWYSSCIDPTEKSLKLFLNHYCCHITQLPLIHVWYSTATAVSLVCYFSFQTSCNII
jgi:hypothetical protein